MPAPSLLHRLKERKLVQWGVAYLAGAWALVEATNLVVDQFHWPEILGQVVTVAAFFGFFVTLVLAWYHGEKGRQRVSGPELLMLSLVLVLAGVGMSRLGGSAATETPLLGVAQPSALARFAAMGSDRPTIAVLPLANLSADPENAYFAAGIHEEILRRLSLIRALAVISRTSVLQYAGVPKAIRDIAAEIGAHYVVEGSVQEDRGRVRIQVQLIDATTDAHVWAERYDRTMDDIFQLQSEVAQAIAGALEAAVTPDEQARIQARPTEDPIAYDLYLRAGELSPYKRDEYDTAVELLRRATRLDPGFALAHARMALLFWNGYHLHRYPHSDSARARAAIAVEVGPRLAAGHAVRAFLMSSASQHDAARAEAEQALALDPSNGFAWGALSAGGWWSGDPVGGALAGRQGVRVDPRGPIATLHLAMNLLHVGMPDEAGLWLQRRLELFPEDLWALLALTINSWYTGDLVAARDYASRMLDAGSENVLAVYTAGYLSVLEGDMDAARASFSRVVPVDPDRNLNGIPSAQAVLAWVEAHAGREGARSRLESLRTLRMQQAAAGSSSSFVRSDLVLIASALGDAEEELRWFLEAIRLDRMGEWPMLRDFPWLDPIRDRPEFRDWLRGNETREAAQQRELAAMGEWTPEAVLAARGG